MADETKKPDKPEVDKSVEELKRPDRYIVGANIVDPDGKFIAPAPQ